MNQLPIETQRKRLLDEWKASGKPFLANFKAYKSTLQLSFVVVNKVAGMAHAVAKPGQTLEFFGYKISDQIPYGPGNAVRIANDADTNLASGRHTNGQEDFIIEGMSLTGSSTRVSYDAPLSSITGAVDPDVADAYAGKAPMLDPAAIIAPPQVNSPFNLENALMSAVLPHISFEIEFDRRRKEQIGTFDQIPEGGGKSYLRANGDPRTDNRIRFPEGFCWRGEGRPDSEMVVRATLRNAVVIPISLVLPPALAPLVGGGDVQTPSGIFLDLALRVHGMSLAPLSRN